MEEFLNQELDIEDLEEDALSFCDLQIHEEADVSPRHQSFSSPSRHFEFCSDLNLDSDFTSEYIMFCGKILDRDSKFTPESIARNQSMGKEFTKTRSTQCKRWNSSIGVVDSSISNPFPLYKDNEKRNKQLVLIGIANVPARMELSEIRKRQSRRAPVPMFPKVIGDSPYVSGESNGWRNLWRLLRPFRYSSRLVTALGIGQDVSVLYPTLLKSSGLSELRRDVTHLVYE